MPLFLILLMGFAVMGLGALGGTLFRNWLLKRQR